MKIAFNSYTIRELLGSPEKIRQTFTRAGEIGYSAVELDLEPLLMQMDVSELETILEKAGLAPFSAHLEFERLEHAIDDVIENCKALGLSYAVVPNLPRERFCKDEAGWRKGTIALASFSEKFAKSGIKFAYHNHAKEFEKFNGKRAMDIVFNESLWKDYLVQIDAYWVQYAGADPAQWFRKYKGRVPLAHIKDLGIVDGKPMTLEVGEGNMNWPYILDACRESRVEWYIVEQDDVPRDPLDSIETSLGNLRKLMG